MSRRLVRVSCACLALASVLIGTAPAIAESSHWGTGAVRLRMESSGIPLATEKPGRTSWSFGPTPAVIAVWHRGTEASVGPASVFGSFDGRRENTLGGTGTASFTFPAPAAGRPFTMSATGSFIRTETLMQVDLEGTASDGNGEVVPVRITGFGAWMPTAGDGILAPITEAEAALTLTVVFPGEMPPPAGPKAASAFDFAGTASLPTFPCPPPAPGESPCAGSFGGEMEGLFGGDAGPGLWAIQMVAPITASFAYVDLLQPGAPCAEGIATGSGAADAGQNDILGFWTDRAGIPRLVTGAQVSFGFDWRRIGVTAVVALRDLDVRLHAMGMGWVQVVAPGSSTGLAVAAFVANLTREHLDACEQGVPGPALTATLDGGGTLDGF